ncbi:MAG: proteasome activator [Acidimicrobiia bacterium]
MTTEPLKPEIVDDSKAKDGEATSEQVTRPTKLIRIASMVRAMLEEVRRAPLDEAGRKHLSDIQEKAISELNEILSPELQDELKSVMSPFSDDDTPSDSELRIAQAQLVGWLEGLFHGIQATLFTQQMAAQSQIEEVRKRMLEAPAGGQSSNDGGNGAYL